MDCAYSYDRLWKLLIDRGMKKKDLQVQAHISSAVIAKMGRRRPVNLETLGKICRVLRCDLNDVVEIIEEKEQQPCRLLREKP